MSKKIMDMIFIVFTIFAMLLSESGLAFGAPLHLTEPANWLEIPFSSNISGLYSLGDVNNDGKADLVIYSTYQGQAWVALSTGSRFAPPTLWANGLPSSQELGIEFDIADVNGDGKADFIGFVHGNGSEPGSANVYVALSSGSVFQYGSNPVWNDGFCITEQICKLADLNGDGKADLIAFTPITGLVWTSLSLGNSFGQNAVWNNYFCIRGEVCEVGDVEGDRKEDLILFKPNAVGVEKGNVLISPSTGSGFGQVRYGHGYFCIDAERCLVGDMNADQRTDILLVKGMSSDINQPAEVLVSLSNGQKFINADPFKWANPRRSSGTSGWGPFYLGDVTGDGRSDLLQVDTVGVPTSGGGSRTVKTVFVVYTTSDRQQDSGSSPSSPSQPSGGVQAVDLYNCDPDQHQFYYWIADLTTGSSPDVRGPINAMYSEWGTCPDPADAPENVPLSNGHTYEIVVVDPLSIGCEGRNDPTIVGCRKHSALFLGNDEGPVFSWIISAQGF